MVHDSPSQKLFDFSLRLPLVEAVGLLLVALIATSASWLLRPDALSWQADPTTYEMELSAPLIDVNEALQLFDEGDYLFIDTRSNAAIAETTIADAFIIREKSFDDDLLMLMDDIYPEDPIVLFGNGELSGVSNITNRLQDRGYENILILRVGVKSWLDAGGMVSPPMIIDLEDES